MEFLIPMNVLPTWVVPSVEIGSDYNWQELASMSSYIFKTVWPWTMLGMPLGIFIFYIIDQRACTRRLQDVVNQFHRLNQGHIRICGPIVDNFDHYIGSRNDSPT